MKLFKKILFIELGTILFALAVGMFLLPGQILTGGVVGVTTLLHPFINIEEDILVIIISSSLFIIGSIVLGKEFMMNTIIHSISYPFILLVITRFLPTYEVDPILASIYGGLIGGVGIGLIFREGGSTGGMDVPPLIIQKYFHIKATTSIMILDALTVLAGLFIYGINNVLIGLISVYLTAFALDKTSQMYGGISAKKIEIISDSYEEISKEIHSVLERGTTYIEAVGGYTNEKKKMIMCIVSDDQYNIVKEIIEKHDKKAFVIVSDTKNVNGEGFTIAPRL